MTRVTLRNATTRIFLLIAVALPACRAGAPSSDVHAAAAPDSEKPTSGTTVRVAAAQLEQIQIEAISTHPPEEVIKTTGVVEFNADRMARILPPVFGQVHDLTVNVGDTVRKSGVLFVLSSRDVAAAIADHRASHKDMDLAEKTFAMTQDLFDHQAASRIAQQQAENELAKATARVKHTEEVLTVLGVEPHAEDDATQSRVPVRTPIDGTVIDRNITNGQFVGPETAPLVTIADLSSVWVQADAFERDLRNITIGQKADVTAAAYPDEHFIAQVTHIGSIVDAQTRTAKVRVLVANRDARLKPGMFTSVSLSLPRSASSLTVPAKAVFVESGNSFAYVQVGPGSPDFVRRTIATAAGGADRLRVVSGLSAGDRIVSDGVLFLRQLEADAPK